MRYITLLVFNKQKNLNKIEDALKVLRQTEKENRELRVEDLGKGISISNYSGV
jgi:hypothetical protein